MSLSGPLQVVFVGLRLQLPGVLTHWPCRANMDLKGTHCVWNTHRVLQRTNVASWVSLNLRQKIQSMDFYMHLNEQCLRRCTTSASSQHVEGVSLWGLTCTRWCCCLVTSIQKPYQLQVLWRNPVIITRDSARRKLRGTEWAIQRLLLCTTHAIFYSCSMTITLSMCRCDEYECPPQLCLQTAVFRCPSTLQPQSQSSVFTGGSYGDDLNKHTQ